MFVGPFAAQCLGRRSGAEGRLTNGCLSEPFGERVSIRGPAVGAQASAAVRPARSTFSVPFLVGQKGDPSTQSEQIFFRLILMQGPTEYPTPGFVCMSETANLIKPTFYRMAWRLDMYIFCAPGDRFSLPPATFASPQGHTARLSYAESK